MKWPTFRRKYAETPSQPDTSERGVVSTNPNGTSFRGVLQQYNNPDDVIRKRGFKYLRQMDDKNGYVYGLTRTRIQAIQRRGWTVQPFDDSDESKAVAEFVEWAIDNMVGSFEDDMAEACDALKFGYAVQEKLWDYTDDRMYRGRVVPVALKAKQQEEFAVDLDDFGNITAIRQKRNGGFDWQDLPPEKFLWWTFDPTPGNPYGKGLYSRVYWHDWFLREGWKFWSVYLERFGSPHVDVEIPPSQSQADIDAAEAILKRMTNETGLIRPENIKVQFLEAVRGGSATYDAFTSAQREAIATVILGQTLSSSQGDVGSQALGTVHKKVQDELTDADCAWMFAKFNDDWVREIVDYNFPMVDGYPVLGPEPRDERDLGVWANIVKTLREAKMPIPLSWVRKTFDIPEPVDGEETLAEPEPPPQFPGFGSGNGNAPPNAPPRQEPPQQNAVCGHDHEQFIDKDTGYTFWRKPTKFEDARALGDLRDGLASLEERVVSGIKPDFVTMRDELLRQVSRAGVFDSDDYDKRLAAFRGMTLKPRTKDFEQTVRRFLLVGGLTGREAALAELQSRGVDLSALYADAAREMFDDVIPPPDDILAEFETRVPVTRREWLAMDRAARGAAFYVASTNGDMTSRIVRDALSESISNDWTMAQFRGRVTQAFGDVWIGDMLGTRGTAATTTRLNLIYRNAVMDMVNRQRDNVFKIAEDRAQAVDPVVAYQISVIMDDRTSDYCRPLDGKIVRAGSTFMARPPYHHNCRTIWVPIVESQANEMGASDLIRTPPTVNNETWQPQAGFGRQP